MLHSLSACSTASMSWLWGGATLEAKFIDCVFDLGGNWQNTTVLGLCEYKVSENVFWRFRCKCIHYLFDVDCEKYIKEDLSKLVIHLKGKWRFSLFSVVQIRGKFRVIMLTISVMFQIQSFSQYNVQTVEIQAVIKKIYIITFPLKENKTLKSSVFKSKWNKNQWKNCTKSGKNDKKVSFLLEYYSHVWRSI